MKNECICQSPLLEAHIPRYPTAHEKKLLLTYYAHIYLPPRGKDPHKPSRSDLNEVKELLSRYYIIVYDNSIPNSPHTINMIYKYNFDICRKYFCYDTFVVPIPSLDLQLMVALEVQNDEDQSDERERAVAPKVIKEYIKERKGHFTHR